MSIKLKSAIQRIFKKRFARFFVVGIINTLVDVGVLALMVALLQAKPEDTAKLIISNTVSGSCSIASSFFLNRIFVFRDGKAPIERSQVAKFIVISLIGAYLINNTILNLVVLHADWLHSFVYSTVEIARFDGLFSADFVKIFTAKAVAGLGSMFWSFWAYGRFVFQKSDISSSRR